MFDISNKLHCSAEKFILMHDREKVLYETDKEKVPYGTRRKTLGQLSLAIYLSSQEIFLLLFARVGNHHLFHYSTDKKISMFLLSLEISLFLIFFTLTVDLLEDSKIIYNNIVTFALEKPQTYIGRDKDLPESESGLETTRNLVREMEIFTLSYLFYVSLYTLFHLYLSYAKDGASGPARYSYFLYCLVTASWLAPNCIIWLLALKSNRKWKKLESLLVAATSNIR